MNQNQIEVWSAAIHTVSTIVTALKHSFFRPHKSAVDIWAYVSV